MQSFFYQIANSKIFEKSAQKSSKCILLQTKLKTNNNSGFQKLQPEMFVAYEGKTRQTTFGREGKKTRMHFEMNTFWLLSSKLKYWMQTTDGYDVVW